MASRRRRQLCLEQCAPKLREQLIGYVELFSLYLQWAAECLGVDVSGQADLSTFEGIVSWILSTDEMETFVLCLIYFGWYSAAHHFFNELDLERMSAQHEKLAGHPKPFNSNFLLIGHDLPDNNFQLIEPIQMNLPSSPFHQNRHLILCKLDPEPVLNYFGASGLVDTDELEKLNAIPTRQQLTEQLINVINKQQQVLTPHFHHSLLRSGQFELFAFLVNNETDWTSLDRLGEQYRQRLLEEWAQESENIRPPPSPKTFTYPSATTIVEDDCEKFTFNVDMPDTTNANDLAYYSNDKANIYKNFSIPKGFVFIINNENFNCELSVRLGTARDEEKLRGLFTELGYTVLDTYKDLTGLEMLSAARQFVKMPEHAKADSCIVVVLTHGENDVLFGVDGNSISTHAFWSCFNSKHAPLLAGKPKIFLMQSCRGGAYDSGAPVPISVDQIDAKGQKIHSDQSSGFLTSFWNKMRFSTSGSPKKQSPSRRPSLPNGPPLEFTTRRSINLGGNPSNFEHVDLAKFVICKQPSEADILIAYATVPNYVSWRNSARGSWFIQTLCEIVAERAKYDHILEILTKVNHAVAKRYESTDGTGSKQVPENISRLRHKFYFFPGIHSES